MVDSKKYKVAPEWVDRVFLRLSEIFGERWTSLLEGQHRRDIAHAQWSTGLYGLSSDEIRRGLSVCLNTLREPPTVVEFFQYARQIRAVPETAPRKQVDKCTPERHREFVRIAKGMIANAKPAKGSREQRRRDENGSLPPAISPERQQLLSDADIPGWLA